MLDSSRLEARTAPLSELSECIFQGISPVRKPGAEDSGQFLSIINVKNIIGGQINIENLGTMLVDSQRDIDRYKVRARDVVITCRGTQLKSAVISQNLDGYLISSNLIAIRLKSNFEPLLLYAFFESALGQGVMLSNIRSSTMQVALTVSDIEKVELPVIPIEMQKQLAGLIRSADQYYSLALTAANLRREIARNVVHEMFVKSTQLLEVKGE